MTSSQTLEKDSTKHKIFNDSVHGHIQMQPLLVKIIDTPEFQRLRKIKQLGGGYFVFPGASHNRFEHSIGVAYLAGELVQALIDHGASISVKDKLCVQIAGLCHDLGHGPFSHSFADFMEKMKPEAKWTHEAASVKMFEQLITRKISKDNQTVLEVMRKEHEFDNKDIVFIEELIYGKNPPSQLFKVPENNAETSPYVHNYKGRGKENSYLYEIVANKRTGIDVDKMDYFSRDCLHLGMKSNFSHERFMKFARVCTNEKNEKVIAMRDKEALNMYELFHVRYLLHHNVCHHRVKEAIEMMIIDALVAADKAGFTLGNEINGIKISDAADVPETFLELTDDILQKIKLSGKSAEANEIIERIEKRDLYSCVGSEIFLPDELEDLSSPKKRDDIVSKWLQSIQKSNLFKEGEKEMFEIKVLDISYGMEDKNPINFLQFYKKDSEDKAVKLPANQVSYIKPEMFSESKVMLFYKKKPALELSEEDMEMFWKIIRKFKDRPRQSKRPREQ